MIKIRIVLLKTVEIRIGVYECFAFDVLAAY